MATRTKAARVALAFLAGALGGGTAAWFLYLLVAALKETTR